MLLFVSDEEDQSAPEVRRNELVTWLEALKPDAVRAPEAWAVVAPLPSGCPDSDATPGAIYTGVARATGGETLSICGTDDGSPFLRRFGERAAGGDPWVELSLTPAPTSVLVRVDLDVRDLPHRSWIGVPVLDVAPIDTDDTDGDTDTGDTDAPTAALVASACAAAGYVDCFGYVVEPELLRIRFTDGWRPPAKATVHVRYRSE
jgi:hypothetical protein